MRYLLLFLLSAGVLFANVQTVKIGVLAKRGAELTLKRWSSMAEYLSQEIPAYQFEIVPIPFNSIFKEVEQKNIDFMLANSGFYVVLERQYGAQRITTLVNKQVTGLTQKEFGGVIFTHIDNKDRFNSLESIKGSHFAAVNEKSLGGWQMAWREFVENDIDRDSDFSSLTFKGTHDKVVYSVLNKEEEVALIVVTHSLDLAQRMNRKYKLRNGKLEALETK